MKVEIPNNAELFMSLCEPSYRLQFRVPHYTAKDRYRLALLDGYVTLATVHRDATLSQSNHLTAMLSLMGMSIPIEFVVTEENKERRGDQIKRDIEDQVIDYLNTKVLPEISIDIEIRNVAKLTGPNFDADREQDQFFVVKKLNGPKETTKLLQLDRMYLTPITLLDPIKAEVYRNAVIARRSVALARDASEQIKQAENAAAVFQKGFNALLRKK